jgi:tetratricopeptide (TPR) repeat protein
VIGWEMAKHRPAGGVGVGGYPVEYARYRRYYVANPSYARLHQIESSPDEYESGAQAHNEYVQIMAELGFVGLALFLALAAQVAWHVGRRCWELRRTPDAYLPLGAGLGLVAFAVSSAVSSFSFRQAPTAAAAACLMALGLARGGGEGAPEGETTGRAIRLPKAAAAAALSAALALAALFTWHGYHKLQSQRLQAEPDLQFSPTDPAKNERWLAEYREALDHDPDNYGAHFGCGVLLFQMKRPAEAARHFEAANRLGYQRPFTNVMLAFAYEQTDRLDQAVSLLEETLAAFPQSAVARITYVEFLRKKGDLDASRREQEVLRRQNAVLGDSVPLMMRMKPAEALEEIRRRKLPNPYDVFPLLFIRAMFQMRTYHYLP